MATAKPQNAKRKTQIPPGNMQHARTGPEKENINTRDFKLICDVGAAFVKNLWPGFSFEFGGGHTPLPLSCSALVVLLWVGTHGDIWMPLWICLQERAHVPGEIYQRRELSARRLFLWMVGV